MQEDNVRADFHVNRSGDSFNKLPGEKKSKSTEKHNLTEILKNCIFRKNGNVIM